MSVQLELSEQSDTSIEEVPPKEEDRLLQEEPDEDVLKLKVDLNTSEKFEEQVDNLVPTNKNPLESLVVTSQKSLIALYSSQQRHSSSKVGLANYCYLLSKEAHGDLLSQR